MMIASVLMMSLGLTSPPGPDGSKGRILESVEWLCLRSDLVVVGRIVSPVDLQSGGKGRGLMAFDLEGYDLRVPERKGTYGIALRGVPLETLNALRDSKAEFAVFLRRTMQSFSYEGKTMDIWPLHQAGGGSWVVPLGVTDAPLISAKTMVVLSDAAALAKTCAAFERPMDVPQYVEPPRAYVPVPASAPAAKALGPRAPTHLLVPASAFPSASTTAPASPKTQP